MSVVCYLASLSTLLLLRVFFQNSKCRYISTLYQMGGHCSFNTEYEYPGSRFKVKVGLNQEDDIRRVSLVRQEVGDDKIMVSNPVRQNTSWSRAESL